MTDGLSQLAQRGRRTRDIPPPRNPARAARVQLAPVPEPAAEPPSPPETSTDMAANPPPAAKPAVSSRPKATPAPVARPAAKSDLKVVTVYLEQDDDDFLETITHTGRTSRPKTAISRSAVVRLALERLHTQMSPAEIVDELRPRGENPGTGRKRR
ncbi:hypothetical protein [uncultured Friedmanniella sp.]|uniref:hypothetical protein n=1 Tax=uncultured Friedmanniella sp. TaxID=335381 RepID=UPI0035CADBD2